jgi:hypothetical protein
MSESATGDADRWSASTVYADMWVDLQDDPRDTGAELADERSVLA